MSKKPKRPVDANKLAKFIVDIATGDASRPEDVPLSDAQISGSKGGKIGGKARANNLTPERRKEIAKRAEKTRWLLVIDAQNTGGALTPPVNEEAQKYV